MPGVVAEQLPAQGLVPEGLEQGHQGRVSADVARVSVPRDVFMKGAGVAIFQRQAQGLTIGARQRRQESGPRSPASSAAVRGKS